MKLKFKINLKKSKIPKVIKAPKTLVEGKFFMGKDGKSMKGKLPNFIDNNHIKKVYHFDYNKKNKILKSIDNLDKHVHGIYSELDLKKAKLVKDGLYTFGWFTGASGRFIRHDWLLRHFITFDTLDKEQVLINYLVFFFLKDGNKNYKPFDKSYIWMDLIK